MPAVDKGECMLSESLLFCSANQQELDAISSWKKPSQDWPPRVDHRKRNCTHILLKKCCSWQAPTPKHSHGPATTHISSLPRQMFQNSFQNNAICATIAKIHFLGCSFNSEEVTVVCLTLPWKGKACMALTITTQCTSCHLAGTLISSCS